MPKIETYDARLLPQGGQLTGRATANDFGGRDAAAIQQFRQSAEQAALAWKASEVADDVTDVHTMMAQKRVEWMQRLDDMANQTQPGDQTLVPRVLDDMKKDFDDLSANVKTQQGQRAFAEMSANMTSMFGQQAVAKQSWLNGEFAKNRAIKLEDDLSKAASKDWSQSNSLIAQGHAAIDDPNGMFAKLPQPVRDEFKYKLAEKVNFDAAMAYIKQYPDAALSLMKPDYQEALQKHAAFPPEKGVPPDLKADTVKPYDRDQVAALSKQIDAASPYDKTFEAAAKLYNIDPRELKMRALVESGFNPKAVSRQNAGGLMQLTPETAKMLGVNRDDPVASIFGAAKLISQYRNKAGGDMSQVDMMYYGGEAGTAWGKNTRQYAANLAALRQTAGLGSARTPESFAPNEVPEDVQRPNGLPNFVNALPPEKFRHVMETGMTYQRANEVQAERARVEEQRNKQVAQEAVMDGFFSRIINPTDANGGKLTEVDVVNDATLTASQKEGIINAMARRTRELATAQENQSNPFEFKNLMSRIYASDLDPNKVTQIDPIREAYNQNKLSSTEFERLLGHLKNSRDPAANAFRKNVNNVVDLAKRTLEQNPILKGMDAAAPGTMADVIYRFEWQLEQDITRLRKEGKDPSSLLDASSSDYVLRPGKIQSFMPNASTTLNQQAGNVAAAQTEGRKAEGGLTIGKLYNVNGKSRVYLGGPINVSTNWD